MKEFTVLSSTALPLKIDNIDTDQIIPARFLKAVSQEGFGEKLFYDWRFDADGKPKTDIVFADSRYKTAKILIARGNFGVGSSREHAAWAIKEYGFRVVLAASFGDIFYTNALKNGLLVVKLPLSNIDRLFIAVEKNPLLVLTIDLPHQQVTVGNNQTFAFQIDPFRKTCLIKGIDDIGYLLNLDKEITEFEMNHRVYLAQLPKVPS